MAQPSKNLKDTKQTPARPVAKLNEVSPLRRYFTYRVRQIQEGDQLNFVVERELQEELVIPEVKSKSR